jgi:alpha-amylase
MRIALVLWLFVSLSHAQAEVILHTFDWPYQRIGERAREIAERGYHAVLVAPPLKSGSDCTWYFRYQPQDLRTIDHCRGNTQDFARMVELLDARKIKVYADVVLNHMANERNGALDFPGQSALDDYQQRLDYWQQQRLFGDLSLGLFGPQHFHEARCITNYNDVVQVQNWRLCGGSGDRGLPDLNANAEVIQAQRSYLLALNALGVKGYRIDAAKHMKKEHIAAVFAPEIIADRYVFAEIIVGGGTGNSEYQSFLKPYLDGFSSHAAYDFPLLHTLKRAFAFSGSFASLSDPKQQGQALSSARALSFVITHDIPNNQGFRGLLFDPVDEEIAYAYVLGRADGVPMVYSDFTRGDNGRWFDAHLRPALTAMVRFHNLTQGLAQQTIASNDCALLFRRDARAMVGLNKCGFDVSFQVETAPFDRGALFRDLLSNHELRIEQATQSITIKARSAAMWLLEKP